MATLDAREIVRSYYKTASPTRRIVRYGKLTKFLAYEITQELLSAGTVTVLFVGFSPQTNKFTAYNHLDVHNRTIDGAEKHINTIKSMIRADKDGIIRIHHENQIVN